MTDKSKPVIYTCSDAKNVETPPKGCHIKVTEPMAWFDGWRNPFCPPCAHRRFSETTFKYQPIKIETDFSASGSGG